MKSNLFFLLCGSFYGSVLFNVQHIKAVKFRLNQVELKHKLSDFLCVNPGPGLVNWSVPYSAAVVQRLFKISVFSFITICFEMYFSLVGVMVLPVPGLSEWLQTF